MKPSLYRKTFSNSLWMLHAAFEERENKQKNAKSLKLRHRPLESCALFLSQSQSILDNFISGLILFFAGPSGPYFPHNQNYTRQLLVSNHPNTPPCFSQAAQYSIKAFTTTSCSIQGFLDNPLTRQCYIQFMFWLHRYTQAWATNKLRSLLHTPFWLPSQLHPQVDMTNLYEHYSQNMVLEHV